jgi:hypothetical protein
VTLAEADWAELERLARAVRTRAHAPYSNYFVGAALQVASGARFAGWGPGPGGGGSPRAGGTNPPRAGWHGRFESGSARFEALRLCP